MEHEERRTPHVKRVPVSTLVEICGLDQAVPPFEAESVELSGRGMHVRTSYLPEVGSPLVCRFEDHGREVIVEGEVAWQRADERGGEFGIKFTALDAGSVEALRDLCDVEADDAVAAGAPEAAETMEDEEPEDDGPDPLHDRPGAKVRLHIDGLGSPMKARVKKGNPKRVDVGSNLEFLKVGKSLEVEDLDAGARCNALIDSVTVAVDPQSQVPQLVVTLRYEGAELTPEPSVIDTAGHDEDAYADAYTGPLTPSVPSNRIDELDQVAGDDAIAEEAEMVRGALRGIASSVASSAGTFASSAGSALARMGTGAASGMGTLLKSTGAKVGAKIESRVQSARPRRTTAPPPSGGLTAKGLGSLRSRTAPGVGVGAAPATERSPAPSEESVRPSRRRKIAAAAAALTIVGAVGAFAMRGEPTEPPGADTAAAEEQALPEDVTQVDEEGNPVAVETEVAEAPSEEPEAPSAAAGPQPNEDGIVADVPLFGPTPMATMEPAPLGAVPDDEDDDVPAAKAVEDETWDEPAKDVDPASVKPWGRGSMHLPVIHRLRLDSPGGGIDGSINPTGFTVVVPGRKVMESGKGISKRDSRIVRVSTKNTSEGAQVSFKFKDDIPGYRVRLRKDYVEFLVSSPKK